MKKIFLLLLLQVSFCALHAQTHESKKQLKPRPEAANPFKDKQIHDEYEISLMPARPTSQNLFGYGFIISKDHIPVIHQLGNAIPFSEKGLQSKADAYKAAHFIVKKYKNTGVWQDTISLEVATKLEIVTQ